MGIPDKGNSKWVVEKRCGCRELGCKESWALQNWCFLTMVLEKTLESLLDCKEIQPVHPKRNQFWIFIGRTDADAETPILWPPDVKNWPWCWERLKAGGKGDNRGWDAWMASLTQWTWVWVNSGSGVMQSMGSQRVGLNWATELNWKCTVQSSSTFTLLCSHSVQFSSAAACALHVS